MSLKEKINADLKVSMLARDSFSTNVLRGLKAAILSEEVAKNKREEGLDDSEIESVIAREVKKRNEAAKLLDEERANNELKEAEILSKYLPEMMNEEEVLKIVQNEISKLDEKSPKQMGQVIGSIKAKYGNSIDGSMLAKMVKEELV
ncbi:GatB/YqeY domain-containing protein [Candidatus Nanogingivalis gingivitcus]|jgi:hypothetical protein cdiviTM7_02614|uniref:GatB/YqeY domain-containing protein n=1 Tax=Candidatus Nanogingivalis gingivitcus TaxID=2171992 RepID=A0ABY0FIP9_9BACT|nr:GatB/YqeY domain-containing protein [Candidatus Nanogingivalis gingivitcus]RYC72687.1 hypothetical protein G6CMJM_00338 [Candidatus Nanogingivalis gingivitcus]